MKLIEAVRTHAHVHLQSTWGWGHGWISHLSGTKFFDMWDEIYGLFNTELLQLGRYALSIQTSETENNMVSRTPLQKRNAQTSGVCIHFSPEKTRGVEDIISLPKTFDHVSSTPHLLYGQGGFKTFLKPLIPLTALTDTNDKAFHSHAARAMRRLRGAVLFFLP